MKNIPVYDMDSTSIEEHSATRMWNILNKCKVTPKSIEKLNGSLSNSKSSIYRLSGICKNGSSVIAKCARQKRLSHEHFVYEKILPQVPISKFQYYGFIKGKQGDSCWLFLEEVKGIPFNKNNKKHKILASVWLAKMHLKTWHLNISNNLPEIGTDTYFNYLNLAQKMVFNNLSHNKLTSDDILMLNRILDLCSCIKINWGEIEEICNNARPCLVHGDFIYKNVRVCNINKVPLLFVFDWEHSGWGIMAEDLGNLDMDVYWSIIKDTKFISSRKYLHQLSKTGLLFRCIVSIYWASFGLDLSYKWIHKSVRRLSYYENDLSLICKERGWMLPNNLKINN